MRREAAQLVRQAVGKGSRAHAIVNNPSEGNAQVTVRALSEMLLGR